MWRRSLCIAAMTDSLWLFRCKKEEIVMWFNLIVGGLSIAVIIALAIWVPDKLSRKPDDNSPPNFG